MVHFTRALIAKPSGCSGSRRAGFVPQPLIRRPLQTPPRASQQGPQTVSSMEIEELDRNYCDDFVCNSSPSVEATIRSFARDLERTASIKTRSLLSRSVEYKDSVRSCKGWEAYQRLDFAATKLQGAKASVQRLRMLDNSTAVVSWRLTGSLGPLPVDVGVESTLMLNVLTGQVEKQRDQFDLSRCSPPAALAWTVTRTMWAAQQASKDAKAGTEKVLQSLSSVDEEDPTGSYHRDPTDPTRFFQQNDNTKQDAFLFAAFVALLWFIYQAYGKIFTL